MSDAALTIARGGTSVRMNERLKFATIPCVRCAAKRVMEMACVECGKAAPDGEVNAPVVRRRQLVKRVRELLSADGSYVDNPQTHPKDELSAIVNDFMSAFSRLLSSNASGEAVVGLADAISRTDGVALQLRRAARTRPVAAARAYLSVATELASLWALYLDLLVTPDPGKAESLAARGQKILYGSTSELERLGTVMRAVDAYSDVGNRSGLVSRVFRALAILHPDVGFDGLVQIGKEQASELATQVAPGAAVDFLTVELVGQAYLDPLQLRTKMAELSVLLGSRDRVRHIAKMPSSLEDLGAARRDLFESLAQFDKLASSESDLGVVLRRLSKTVAELYEAALPLFVWCRLILTPAEQNATYDRLVMKDATEHVAWIVKRLPLTYSDAPSFLRHAAHHGRALDIGADGASVAIKLRSFAGSFTAAEYIDRAYALLESLLAVSWVIGNTLELEGLEVPLPPGAAEYMGLPAEAFAEFWLREIKGVDVRSSRREGDSWWLELEVSEAEVVPIALALATTGAPILDRLTVSNRRYVGPCAKLSVQEYLRYTDRSAGGKAETALAILELRHQVRVGEGCLVSEGDAEFVIVCLGLAVLDGDLSQVRLLREARQQATRHGFGALAALANRVLATIRTGTDWDVRVELSERTRSFTPVSLPVLPSVTVLVRQVPDWPQRSCD